MTIDELIEELRAELNACVDACEIHRIERELQAALAERMRLETALEPFG